MRLTVSLGMAKPMPTEAPVGETITELTPITWPSMLNTGPPELPGLIGASSCRKLSNGPEPRSRPSAEMMPTVHRSAQAERIAGGQDPVADLDLAASRPR